MYIRTNEGLVRGLIEYGLGAWTASVLPRDTNGKLYQFTSANGGSTTAVYVPDGAPGADPVSLLVWIHGDIIPCGDEGKDSVSYVKSTQFPLARQIAESKLPFVLVAPTMQWNWKNNKESHDYLGGRRAAMHLPKPDRRSGGKRQREENIQPLLSPLARKGEPYVYL